MRELWLRLEETRGAPGRESRCRDGIGSVAIGEGFVLSHPPSTVRLILRPRLECRQTLDLTLSSPPYRPGSRGRHPGIGYPEPTAQEDEAVPIADLTVCLWVERPSDLSPGPSAACMYCVRRSSTSTSTSGTSSQQSRPVPNGRLRLCAPHCHGLPDFATSHTRQAKLDLSVVFWGNLRPTFPNPFQPFSAPRQLSKAC